jgi:hypothetical protein
VGNQLAEHLIDAITLLTLAHLIPHFRILCPLDNKVTLCSRPSKAWDSLP